ncbi:MAG: HK97 gp10 family phage protein [Gemmatimonadales bacterium]|nr:HK97 gp10 family phage protein [Gemmatimonadales bacterium]
MTASAKIVNAERLLAKLAKLPDEVRDKIKAAMEAQAEEITAMMRRLAADPKIDASIGWRWGASAPRGSMAVASVQASADDDMTITIFAGGGAAFYARWWEFGTDPRVQKKTGRRTGVMPANPFFYVSFRANRKNAKRRIQYALRAAGRKVAAS